MVESARSQRSLSGVEEFDRRMRTIAQSSTVHSEALAELARLVGQQDPFGEAQAPQPTPEPPPHDDHQNLPVPPLDFASYDASLAGGLGTSGTEAGVPAEPAIVQAPALQQPEPWERAVPRYPSFSVRDPRPIEPSPDAWAQAAGEDESVAGPVAPVETQAREAVGARRTLVVLAAVVVLTGGGLAASFLARPSSGVLAADRTPTILAASGPSKVQPPETADADAPSAPSTLLDKNKNDGTAAAKLVDNVEQPVDLGQAMKPTAISPSAPPSPFPEPHKVKTVLVRPDGTIITDAAPPVGAAVPGVPANQEASLAFDPTTALQASAPDRPAAADPAPPAATAATPPEPEAAPTRKPPLGKTTARIPAAKAASSTSQGGSAAAEGRSPVATPKAKTIAHARPKPKPAEAAPVVADAAQAAAAPDAGAPPAIEAAPPAADAAPAATALSGAGGRFAVQLGAAPSQAEGQAAATRLGQKYAGDLGGAKPSVHKADAGGKTVYRIRVGNLSQDDAKAMCAKVTAGGGGCFVARN